jgi:hypothetical protein
VPDEPRLRRSALFAGVAEGVVATALPLLATNLTHEPLPVAGVVVAQHLPWLLVALGWHALNPRDRRTVIGLIDTVRALAVAYLGFVALAGTDTMRTIYVVAFIVGLGEALTGTVEEETADTAKLSTRGMLGMALVGMPLGGLLYEVFIAVPFVIDIMFFALAALFALFVPRPVVRGVADEERPSRPRFAPGTLPVTITALVSSIARAAVLAVLVLFALENLGLGAPAFGLLLAGLAAATACGGFVAPETGSALGLRAGFAVASVIAGGALVTANQVASPDKPWMSAIALGVAWATATTAMVLLRALLPVAAGRPVSGSHLRALHLVEWAGVCIGAVGAGWLAADHGVGHVVQWAAGPFVLAAITVIAVRRAAPVAAIAGETDKWLDAA